MKQTELRTKLHQIRSRQPLIHCITNHISINDCANAVLALGAKPIMAEHPMEVHEITAGADALAVNLGNISDTRMEAMMIAGKTARQQQIPSVMDVVGVSCSKLRLDFAKAFIRECSPSVIKGNEAELRALFGLPCHSKGIDVCCHGSQNEIVVLAKEAAKQFNAAVLISSRVDAASDGINMICIENGSPLMPYITGTGCMLNVLCGTFLAVISPLESAVCAAAAMGIAGELAQERYDQTGRISDFHNALQDGLFHLEQHTPKARIVPYETH